MRLASQTSPAQVTAPSMVMKRPKLSDSNPGGWSNVRSLRAGINPAPTQRVGQPVVGAGFTPARMGWRKLQIAQSRKRVFQQPARSLLGFAAKRSSSGGLGRLVGDLQPDSASGERLPLADTRTSVDRGNQM